MTDPAPTPPSADDLSLPTRVVDWKDLLAKFQQPCVRRATWQIINTFGLYGLLWFGMYWALALSWWVALPLALVAGGLLVRIFIIFHDCGHGSFLPSTRANDIVGFLAGLLTFTPYQHWRWEHSIHHGASSDLDRRGTGDIWTLTVEEYLASSPWRRLAYRLSRNPFVLLGIAPVAMLGIRQRFPAPQASRRERNSVWWNNLALVALAAALSLAFGWKNYLLLQLIIIMVGGAAGIWIFYVQHQFEDAYWARNEEWDFTAAALRGSSYYRLPALLQWFSGNIGFHHIHHLSPRIPNYHLERCHRSNPVFSLVPALTLGASFRTLRLHLWDEASRRLISFRDLRARRG
jgi:acyl-lipid omega-6 desaturase (Delta-12 desaturase)